MFITPLSQAGRANLMGEPRLKGEARRDALIAIVPESGMVLNSVRTRNGDPKVTLKDRNHEGLRNSFGVLALFIETPTPLPEPTTASVLIKQSALFARHYSL